MRTRVPHILIAGTGAGGGIGRFERLLIAALGKLSERDALRFNSVWRRHHPAYLQPFGDVALNEAGRSAETSLRKFTGQLAAATLRDRPDLVLFTHVNLARAAPVARAFGGRRYAVIAYGVEVWSRLEMIRRRSLESASGVVAISEYTADRLVEHQRLQRRSIHVIPLALEPYWLEDAAGVSGSGKPWKMASKGGPRLLTVSRLEPSARDKGIHHVIQALPEVRSAIPGVCYHVVGDGPDRAYLERLAQDYGVMETVVFRGAISSDDLANEYRAADAFVLPSQREGFGLVFLEAMAHGKPVIARRATAVVEIVDDGKTGILVDNEQELAASIISVLSDADRARAMGQSGLERLQAAFSFDAFTAKIAAALNAFAK